MRTEDYIWKTPSRFERTFGRAFSALFNTVVLLSQAERHPR